MSKSYQKSSGKSDPILATKRQASKQLVHLVSEHGHVLLPMVQLIQQSKLVVSDVIMDLGRTMLEAMLEISAAEAAGPPHQGKRTASDIVRHGRQSGYVTLADRKLAVTRPRLRRRGSGENGEVEVPAYAAMQNGSALQDQILNCMMRGVTTRNFSQIVPDSCDAVGISKSSVSRQFVLASEQECTALLARRFNALQIPVIYIDGITFGEHHVIAAVGIDHEGKKHILGLREGATENATVVSDLLQDMVERGVAPGVRRLFVIDGSKALRSAITSVFGKDAAVQRCRVHKVRNVTDYLPKDRREDVKKTMQAAFRLGHEAGTRKLLTLAEFYDKEYPSAAASLREGLDELFTVSRLGVPSSLARCLVSTNIIESANSGVRTKTNRVSDWDSGAMVLRWAASAFVASEASFRRVSGYTEIDCLISALSSGLLVKAA
jgi:transposase-like protein